MFSLSCIVSSLFLSSNFVVSTCLHGHITCLHIFLDGRGHLFSKASGLARWSIARLKRAVARGAFLALLQEISLTSAHFHCRLSRLSPVDSLGQRLPPVQMGRCLVWITAECPVFASRHISFGAKPLQRLVVSPLSLDIL